MLLMMVLCLISVYQELYPELRLVDRVASNDYLMPFTFLNFQRTYCSGKFSVLELELYTCISSYLPPCNAVLYVSRSGHPASIISVNIHSSSFHPLSPLYHYHKHQTTLLMNQPTTPSSNTNWPFPNQSPPFLSSVLHSQ